MRAVLENLEKRSIPAARSKTWTFPRQQRLALILLSANALLLFSLAQRVSPLFYPWLFGLLFGFVLQRSRFCFAAASRDIFLIRNTMLTRALLLAFILSSLGFLLLEILTPGVELLFTQGKLQPAGVSTAAGAFFFGIGMVIAGSCASGMLMRMGEGYMLQWLVMPGFLLGSALGAWHLGWWYDRFIAATPVVFLPHLLDWPLAVLLQLSLLSLLFFLACLYQDGWQGISLGLKKRPFASLFKKSRQNSKKPEKKALYDLLLKKPWPYVAGGALLAMLNTAYFALWGAPWGITDGITFLAGWLGDLAGFSPENWHYFQGKLSIDGAHLSAVQGNTGINYFAYPLTFHFMAVIMGSLLSTLLAGEFRLRKWRSRRFVPAALLGGLLMGYGSRIALGCNIGAYFSAIPSFSLHGWVFGLFILIGAYLGGKILLRYLVD